MESNLVSIVIPVYDMPDKDYFLNRCIESIKEQTYTNYEVIISETGKGMAGNTNEGIKQAKGDIIKILFMDDYFAHKDALKRIVEAFKGGWIATGCTHTHGQDRFNEHLARYNENILSENTIGSPSVIAFENKDPLLFDENMTWVLDCDLYKRLYDRYGEPTILDDINVVIGVGDHQTTSKLSIEEKLDEQNYLIKKYI